MNDLSLAFAPATGWVFDISIDVVVVEGITCFKLGWLVGCFWLLYLPTDVPCFPSNSFRLADLHIKGEGEKIDTPVLLACLL